MSSTMAEAGVYRGSFEIDAGVARVWSALTKAEHLTVWFAEKVEVVPRVGGMYRFWGRHTPTLGVAGEPDQTITAFEENERLAFSWTWGGVPGRCELRLSEENDATRLSVEHTWDGEMHPHLVADFWELAAGNLECYLRTGAPALLPDHSEFREEVALSINIDASAARVWEVITEPGEMRKFLGELMACDPRVELREGGVYSYGWEHEGESIGPREILELEAGRRLVHSWAGEDGETTTKTEWTVEALGDDRARLSVRQYGIGSELEFNGYANGWASFMVAMKRVGERR